MDSPHRSAFPLVPASLRKQCVLACLAFLACGIHSGCVAITNPTANGIPVRRLPQEILGESRNAKRDLPLSRLSQRPPEAYRLATGDVLGIWIPGILGEQTQLPPVNLAGPGTQPAAIGDPIPVGPDGNILLPLVAPVNVQGMTLEEAKGAIYDAYVVKKKILNPDARIIVTLFRRRVYHILVFRQDGASGGGGTAAATTGTSITVSAGGAAPAGGNKRSVGFAVDLPAYENDVLHALALTGGLPGLDAINEVIIERGALARSGGGAEGAQRGPCPPGEAYDPMMVPSLPGGVGSQVTRIPLRVYLGQPPPFQPEDVVLRTGDIVFIEAREAEFYYTAGILPPGAHVVPRDYDLDVLQAVSISGGPILQSGVNPNNITGATVGGGFGFPNPSLLSILRRTAGGGQVTIRVDINRALRDPRERIFVQPGDVLILQERLDEALARYFIETFRYAFFWQFIHGPHESAVATGAGL
jgi:hypothetical protein